MDTPETDVYLEAKRMAASLARRGKLLSPHDAWLLSGETKGSETLWSIAFKLGIETGESAEDLNKFLEQQFPEYTRTEGRNYRWDDFVA